MSEQPPNLRGRARGKVALVTGAGSGIGRAAAILLAREGAVVVCTDIDIRSATDSATVIRARGGAASFRQLDVTSESAWQAVIDQVSEEQGRFDILVNSAGISFARPIAEMTVAEWRRVMAVNLEGVFLGTKHTTIAMRKQKRGGSIVNVSSVSGIKASPGASAYCTSKAAVCMFSKTVATECAQSGDNIRINTVCPGGVKTPLWKTMPFFQELMQKTGSEEAAFRAMARSSPHGRFAEPEEIAPAILYLASDESLFVTGTDLIIDAGYSI